MESLASWHVIAQLGPLSLVTKSTPDLQLQHRLYLHEAVDYLA